MWGRSRNLYGVHYYDQDGMSLCKDRNGRHTRLAYPRPGWDPRHIDTCEKCIIARKDQITVELAELTALEEAARDRQKAAP